MYLMKNKRGQYYVTNMIHITVEVLGIMFLNLADLKGVGHNPKYMCNGGGGHQSYFFHEVYHHHQCLNCHKLEPSNV
jgi:hypothetical protein